MSIAVKPRKGLRAKRIAEERPDLAPEEIARLVGTNKRYVERAIAAEQFGRDKPKSKAR
jgi:hypothetical protein